MRPIHFTVFPNAGGLEPYIHLFPSGVPRPIPVRKRETNTSTGQLVQILILSIGTRFDAKLASMGLPFSMENPHVIIILPH